MSQAFLGLDAVPFNGFELYFISNRVILLGDFSSKFVEKINIMMDELKTKGKKLLITL
jgi:hypothetical protein